MAKNHRVDTRLLVRTAVFGGATVVSTALYFLGMVRNGNGAVQRYNTLVAVDKAGGDVEAALNELRSYIYAHMNTEIGGENGVYPPIQLRETYNRLVAAEKQRVDDANKDLIVRAKDFCENSPQRSSVFYRVDCVGTYVDQNGAKPAEIESSLYQYDFVAPRWSPDLAGFSLIGIFIFGSVSLVSLFVYLRSRSAVHIAN